MLRVCALGFPFLRVLFAAGLGFVLLGLLSFRTVGLEFGIERLEGLMVFLSFLVLKGRGQLDPACNYPWPI